MRRSLLVVIAIAALAAAACGYPDPYANTGPVANESPGPTPSGTSAGGDDFNAGAGLPVVTYPDGLKVIDLKVGTGDSVKLGEIMTADYTGWLSTGGPPFDTSRQAGRSPIKVLITQDQSLCSTQTASYTCVISGWNEGVLGMRVGGKRKLIIPPALGYGSQQQASIPANSTLVFEIELLSIAPGPTPSPSPSPSPSPTPSK